ncbi:MAG: FliG C-terminal domain-containing protein [Rubripirellula sp.]
MANHNNSATQREAMLRRVAIVLSSLPPATAAQLMGSIDPQSKQAVRRTMTSLSDVDPLERQRALKAFKVSAQTVPSAVTSNRFAASDAEAISPAQSGSRIVPSSAVSSSASSQASAQRTTALSFLADVEDDTLVSLLASEHPQAIALVLASIAPAQAARVLPRLDPRTQSDALSRIGRLGEIPQEAVAEVAQHFQQRISETHSNSESGGAGQNALNAILAALPSTAKPEPQTSTVPADAGRPAVTAYESQQIPPVRPVNFPSIDAPAVDLTHKLRVAEETWPESVPDPQPRQEAPPSTTIPSQPTEESQPASQPHSFESTDAIHQHLIRLPAGELCAALGKVDTRAAMLTLCGLSTQVADAVLALLPKAQAKEVRIKMNSLGSINLRDIDEAKEVVANASVSPSASTDHQVPMAA